MQHLEVSGAVWPLKWSLGVKWLNADWLCHAIVNMTHEYQLINSIGRNERLSGSFQEPKVFLSYR